MKKKLLFILIFLLFSITGFSSVDIPADNPFIQYFGRWDFSTATAPSHSWPGVYIYAEFEGTSIGIKLNDNYSYYNVIIDGNPVKVLHGTVNGISTYSLATGLTDGKHTLLFVKRNETAGAKYSFHGFILDDGKSLLEPKSKPVRKIEFIGDSYTCGQGNEHTGKDTPPDAPVSNNYEAFGAVIARHYQAQYQMTSRSGYGLTMDYQGNLAGNIPDQFDRTLTLSAQPKWDFSSYIPNLVVIALGLNDYSAYNGYNGPVSNDNRLLFKSKYHQFIATIRDVYPGVKILAVATQLPWLKTVIEEVVAEEKQKGNNDVFPAFYPQFPDDGYVYGWHPSVATHHKIADSLITYIDKINAWETYTDTNPPTIVKYPEIPVTVYDSVYTLKIETDSYSMLKFSTEDKSFDDMEYSFAETGKRTHTSEIKGKSGETKTIFVRGSDLNGNKMPSSVSVQISFDTTKVLLNWTDFNYDHSNWKKGITPIGFGGSASIKTESLVSQTVYFRQKFSIVDISDITGVGILVKGNDGAVVYLNSHEIGRINLDSENPVPFNLFAQTASTLSKMFVVNSSNGLAFLKAGENTVSVELHIFKNSTALTFDSQFIDNKNRIHYKLGSEWSFEDSGKLPDIQLYDKVSTDVESHTQLPQDIMLFQNYPNPFNPKTIIQYRLEVQGTVELKVFDLLGREIKSLVSENKLPGNYKTEFDASSLSGGMYLYQLKSGTSIQTKKMMVIK